MPTVHLDHAPGGGDEESKLMNDLANAFLLHYRSKRPPAAIELEDLVVGPHIDLCCASLSNERGRGDICCHRSILVPLHDAASPLWRHRRTRIFRLTHSRESSPQRETLSFFGMILYDIFSRSGWWRGRTTLQHPARRGCSQA